MNVQQLAHDFASFVHEALTKEQMVDLVKLNKVETDWKICHSHDFCDANQLMLDALAEQDESYSFDSSDTGIMQAIDDAWNQAKVCGFDLYRMGALAVQIAALDSFMEHGDMAYQEVASTASDLSKVNVGDHGELTALI